MRINKMINLEKMIEYKKQNGESFPAERCSGRTLGLAFLYIGTAMNTPNKEFEIRDHWDTVESHRSLASLVRYYLEFLKLRYINIYSRNNRFYIKYNIFTEI